MSSKKKPDLVETDCTCNYVNIYIARLSEKPPPPLYQGKAITPTPLKDIFTPIWAGPFMRFLCVISRWNHSFTRLFTLLRAALWRKIDLWDLLRLCGTAGGHFRYLATPENAYFPGFA